MRSRLPVAVRAATVGVAGSGVLVAHWMAYWLVAPDAHGRGELLQATGHRYLPIVVAALLGVLVMGLARSSLALLNPTAGCERMSLRAVLSWLLAAQLMGFCALELGERMISGSAGSILHVIQEPVFLVGVILQVAVAALNAVLVRSFVRVVGRVRACRRSTTSLPAPVAVWLSLCFVASTGPCRGAATLRAPPLAQA